MVAEAKLTRVTYTGARHVFEAEIDGTNVIFVDGNGNSKPDLQGDSIFAGTAGSDPSAFAKYGSTFEKLVGDFEKKLPEELQRIKNDLNRISATPTWSYLCSAKRHSLIPQAVMKQNGTTKLIDMNADRQADTLSFKTSSDIQVEISSATWTPGLPYRCLILDQTRLGVEKYLQVFDKE